MEIREPKVGFLIRSIYGFNPLLNTCDSILIPEPFTGIVFFNGYGYGGDGLSANWMSGFPPGKTGRLKLQLPGWIDGFIREHQQFFGGRNERMDWVIELGREHIRQRTGGPFAAAVFDMDHDRIVSAGVNLVTALDCSILHAEIVALILAQQKLKAFDLAAISGGRFQLVTSAEPCTMCLGAVVWSGVRCLVCGARDEDARAIGFDEGPKPVDWPGELERRGVEVVRDVRRNEAVEILNEYKALGREIYNSRR